MFNRLGSILLLTAFAGGLALLVGSFSLSFILQNLNFEHELVTIVQLICVFLVPGGTFGVEKDLEYQLFINSQIFSVLFVYPLAVLLPKGPAEYFKGWIVGFVIGIVVGIIGSILLKYFKYSKTWNSLEVLSTGLISLLAAFACEPIGGCTIVALVVSSFILSKYTNISDVSKITMNNLYITGSGVIEIIVQVWIGVKLVNIDWQYQLLPLLIFLIIVLLGSYAITMGLAYLCKLKSIKLIDCLSFTFGGFKGIASMSLIHYLPTEVQPIAISGLVLLSAIGMVLGYFLTNGKDESNYLISSNPCSKLKSTLQNLEETYLVPVFVKENVEKSILSPKFNDNSQRFDAGIQMRPEIRDETSRELQALNLNLTESEMQGGLQLK